ncbi:zinc ABC transporter substrate-binding protein [Gemmobacter aquarius]|uniref:High-affinity zinc uptake system protein ZnuA n=1 Tax=Paragemmobacter aquarius TaxID=2169400 RepID=A0A2S0UHE7_9RHOB|nr:zinc ABC transporter substrate-binding protein [Gemmobacter aquarius]AWB47234.1 zinc ABC transporter substrate-binding protein [Gemmobacter aquarius]
MRYIISLARTSLVATGLHFGLGLAAAQAQVPDVVTDIPPVHSLVAQVMGDLGTPTLLLTKGASEHDFQLRPSQAQALADAELVVWIGPELTPWLDRAMQGLTDAESLPLLDAPETATRPFSADGAHLHDDHADGAHDHTGTDPHAWLDPANAKAWLGLIAARLAALDPANAATYAANAAQAQAATDALDARIAAELAPLQDRPFVVYHDAYGYFAARYGLQIAGSVALGDATAPGAAKLSALQQGLAAGQATCLFPEAQHDTALAVQLVEGTSLRLGPPLDPVGSTLTPGAGAYAALIETLATAIAGCLTDAP